MAKKRIIDLPQIDTGDIDAGKVLPVDDIITEKITLQQIADWIIAQVPPSEGGGSPITAVQQNVVNEKWSMPAIPIENAGWDSYSSDRNITYTLASNYAQGATSIELTCTAPSSTFKPIYPCRIIVYDGTNKSYAVITGFTSGTNYTLASALVNQNNAQVAYSTSTAVVKLKMKTRSMKQAIVPTGLTGQALAEPEDIMTVYLQKNVAAKKLTTFRQFFNDRYVVNGLPSSTTTELTSATDKSTVFPIGAKVALFSYIEGGVGYQSKYVADLLMNFKIVTLTATSTYAGGKITLTHANETNTGVSVGTFSAVKLPKTKAIVEADSAAGVPAELTVKSLLPIVGTDEAYTTAFAYADQNPIAEDGWTVVWSGSSNAYRFRIATLKAYANAASGVSNNSNLLRTITYDPNGVYRFKWRASGVGGVANVGSSYFGFLCPDSTMDTSGLTFHTNFYDHSSGNFRILLNGTAVYTSGINTYPGDSWWFDVIIDIPRLTVFFKLWQNGQAEPDSYSTQVVASIPRVQDKVGFKFVQQAGTSDLTVYSFQQWVYRQGYAALYELENQTGNKVTITTPSDVTSLANETPIDLGVGFIIQ